MTFSTGHSRDGGTVHSRYDHGNYIHIVCWIYQSSACAHIFAENARLYQYVYPYPDYRARDLARSSVTKFPSIVNANDEYRAK